MLSIAPFCIASHKIIFYPEKSVEQLILIPSDNKIIDKLIIELTDDKIRTLLAAGIIPTAVTATGTIAITNIMKTKLGNEQVGLTILVEQIKF
jgi:hypothetical protein